jgi:benzylsuccinate CoA-transferase BbsF subunit
MVSVVLAALDHRRRTGEGGHLDFAQAEAALHFLTPALLELQTTGVLPSRRGNGDASADPHGVWASADDGWVAVACETDGQRAALVGLLGETTLESWLRDRGADDAVAELIAAGVPAHRVQGPFEADVDPQLEAVGHWVEVAHPVHETLTVERTRFDLSRTPVGPRRAAPTLNQHAHDVLVGMLGYSEEHFAQLTADGVLR